MESKSDILTILSAIGVAAYAAIAIRFVARYELGVSLQEIRGAAIEIALGIAALIAINFLSQKAR